MVVVPNKELKSNGRTYRVGASYQMSQAMVEALRGAYGPDCLRVLREREDNPRRDKMFHEEGIRHG